MSLIHATAARGGSVWVALPVVLSLLALQAAPSGAGPGGSTRIAFSDNGSSGGIYTVNPDGTQLTRLTDQFQDSDPVWSPNGRWIAFVRPLTLAVPREQLYVMNADGSGQRRLASGESFAPSWSPESRHALAWSPDSRKIAFANYRPGSSNRVERGTSEIYVVDVASGRTRKLTSNRIFDGAPAWAPGSRIAFVRAAGADSSQEIYVMDADGRHQRRLTRNRVEESQPDWSPNRRRIAFVRGGGFFVDETTSVFLMNADGSAQQRLARPQSGSPVWSRDGSRIAFVRLTPDGDAQVNVIGANGRSRRVLAEGTAPAWSSDGRIAFAQSVDLGGRPPETLDDIFVVGAGGGAERQVTTSNSAREPDWQPR